LNDAALTTSMPPGRQILAVEGDRSRLPLHETRDVPASSSCGTIRPNERDLATHQASTTTAPADRRRQTPAWMESIAVIAPVPDTPRPPADR
jgi:hypothetical protein